MNEKQSPGGAMDDLRRLIKTLRGEGGCPWDRKQTPQTAKGYLLEEAYEAIDAINHNQTEELREEFGDLLFQLIFLVELYEEKSKFTLEQVIGGVVEKMTRRHPHVFGDVKVDGIEEIWRNWNKIKEQERGKKESSLLDSIPAALPALLKAHRVGERTSKVGFDWGDAAGAAEKAEEEWREFKELLAVDEPDRGRLAEEFGDLLFSMVNVSRLLKINAEFALQSAVEKFTKRFKQVQREITLKGKSLHEAGLAEMDAAWDDIKTRGHVFEAAYKDELARVQRELGYEFQDARLLESALCHTSFANENPALAVENNERLEFLGDAILDLVLSRSLFERFPEAREGDLTRWRSQLVNEMRLAEVARSINLGPALLLGTGEENSGGRNKSSILADAMEALIAAVYLDGGLEATGRTVELILGDLVDQVVEDKGSEDYKSRLQELTQATHKIAPDYCLIQSSGPDHDKTFEMSVRVKGREIAVAKGKSKKEAAQNAARKALTRLERDID